MVSKAKKGYNKEKKIRDILISQGWKLMFKSTRTRYGTFDFGELFDSVFYKGQERKYVSSKHFNGYYLQHQKEIKEFKEIYGKDGESYELWIWKSPRWEGAGKNKHWWKGGFIKIII